MIERKELFDKEIEGLLRAYSIHNEPIEVNFRTLLPEQNKSEKYTHLIHWYPAKLLNHIPFFFLNSNLILDPFCGSGTVLLESILSNRNAIGADSNPLARLISKVKTTKYNCDKLKYTLSEIISTAKVSTRFNVPDVINRDYWFLAKSQNELCKIYDGICTHAEEDVKDFFMVCFSACVKKVSLTDPSISVPVKINTEKYTKNSASWQKANTIIESIKNGNTIDKFEEITKLNISRHSNLNNISICGSACVISEDARVLTKELLNKELIEDRSVDLILTSPPYAGAQKYIRSSFLNIGWLGLANSKEIKLLDSITIGREEHPRVNSKILLVTGIEAADKILEKIFQINPTRAYIAGKYIIEMKQALDESCRVLKSDGYMILVLGNNQVCGYEFNTQDYITNYLESKNMRPVLKLIDNIKSYGLMTKRNKTASIITREWVLIFKKQSL